MPTLHAFDFLAAPDQHPAASVCAVFGDEPFLKQQVTAALRRQVLGADSETPFATFDADEKIPEWRDVFDELSTASLFGGGGRRLVVLQRADAFVTAHRPRLEDYVAKPRSGVLILEVGTWASNTRLYKALDQSGLQIECGPPMRAAGKNKAVDEPKLVKWLSQQAKDAHGFGLKSLPAELLLELVGPNLGMLSQDLAKLALYVKPGADVSAELVQSAVGGWRAKTTWDAIDAATDGNAAEALLQLDHLLQSGEHPLALFGSIAWSLRRYAAATRVFQRYERAGRKILLSQALLEAGFKDWPKGTLENAERRLKRMGRERAGGLYRRLLEADLAMKGTHSHESRARLVLEQLFLQLAGG